MSEHTEQALVVNGTILHTADGSNCSNAIVIDMNGGTDIKVLTDFGNILTFDTAYDVLSYFNVSEEWKTDVSLGIELPSVVARIQKQIDLLTTAKTILSVY